MRRRQSDGAHTNEQLLVGGVLVLFLLCELVVVGLLVLEQLVVGQRVFFELQRLVAGGAARVAKWKGPAMMPARTCVETRRTEQRPRPARRLPTAPSGRY